MRYLVIVPLLALLACGGSEARWVTKPSTRASMRIVSAAQVGDRIDVELRNDGDAGSFELEVVALGATREVLSFGASPAHKGFSGTTSLILVGARAGALKVRSGTPAGEGGRSVTDCKVLAGDSSYCQ